MLGKLIKRAGGAVRRILSSSWAALRELPARVWPLLRWIWRGIRRLGRTELQYALLGVAVLLVAGGVLGMGVALYLVYGPSTQFPPLEPVDEIVYLDQGWGPSRDSELRQRYYYTPQGASIKGFRYRWFVNLELPLSRRRMADPDHLRFRHFLVDTAPTAANPDLLPVGLTKHYDPDYNEEVLDITCAACHTGQVNINRNGKRIGIRIDGGPSMLAFASTKPRHFVPVMVGSMIGTLLNPLKFNRFARNVLGNDHYDEGKSELRRELASVLWVLLKQAASDQVKGLYPVEEGFGRTDAIGRIGNNVFGDHLTPDNYRVSNAPVSYPPLWNIWKFDWVQYGASVRQPLARNLGESLGTGAKFFLEDPYGRPVEPNQRYLTSAIIENLYDIEQTIKQLQPPQWPEQLLGAVDRKKAEQGRVLFQKICQKCHGPHPADADWKAYWAPGRKAEEPLWIMAALPLTRIGTDPMASINFVNKRFDLSPSGLTEVEVRRVIRPLYEEDLKRKLAYLQKTGKSKEEIEKARQEGEAAIASALDQVDLDSVSLGAGLQYLGAFMRELYYRDNRIPPAGQARLEGDGILDLPETPLAYKARPLAGIWASAPYLHNGSVPNLYQMLSPVHERARKFMVGHRDFDPVNVGYVLEPPSKEGWWLDTTLPGNSNNGHEFRAGYVPGAPQYGVIGPEFTPEERMAIIEYLKIHQDDPAPAAQKAGAQ